MSFQERYKVKSRRPMAQTLFGAVYLAQHRDSGTNCVAKVYDKRLVSLRQTRDGSHVAEDAELEIEVHRQLCSAYPSPYILNMLDLLHDDSYIYVILELCEKGDLFSYISVEPFRESAAQMWSKQMFAGVYHMHSNGFVHRDLSPENLLITSDNELKLSDFGVACEAKDGEFEVEEGRRPGKLRYMAPEIYAGGRYNAYAADIWSCGVIIFTMLFGVFPYELPCEEDKNFCTIMNGQMAALLDAWGKSYSEEAVDLLSRIFQVEENRATMEGDIIPHAWLN